MKVLTQEQVAKQLNVSTRTLRHWRSLGKFPQPFYLGRRAYYDPQQVEDFISKAKNT